MRMKLTVVVSALCLSLSVLSDELTADEKAVWQLEESYWRYVKNDDISGYLTLWDERFVGWPGFSRTPTEKDSIGGWIPPLHDDLSVIYDYTLTREAVRSFGDVVVAHYLVRDFYRSASTSEILRKRAVFRVTHTRGRGDKWQIVTGMSGTLIGDDGPRQQERK